MPYYIENCYIEFVNTTSINLFDSADITPIFDFMVMASTNKPFTEKQSQFVIRLMKKYEALCNFAYTSQLTNPIWKHPFRIISTEKHIAVLGNNIYMKFPYSSWIHFRDEFNYVNENVMRYDPITRDRAFRINEVNVIQLLEFTKTHQFVIDDSFDVLVSDVEEIWQQEESSIPYSTILNNEVLLINASRDANAYWNDNKISEVDSDLLLAKSMGFRYNGIPSTTVQEIASNQSNSFWMKDIDVFLQLCTVVPGKICIIIDRASDTLDWITSFIDAVLRSTISISKVKLANKINCKDTKDISPICKQYEMNKNISDAKIIICIRQPNNMLNLDDIQLVATNNIYQSSLVLLNSWLEAHPCVIYLGDYKPSLRRLDLVNLHNSN